MALSKILLTSAPPFYLIFGGASAMFVPLRNLPIPSPISSLFLAGGEAADAVPLDSEGGGGGGGRGERRKKLKRERVEGSASAASLVLGGRRRRRQAAEGEDSEEREDEEPKRTPLRFANERGSPSRRSKKKPG